MKTPLDKRTDLVKSKVKQRTKNKITRDRREAAVKIQKSS